jgi:hypothetical protein
MAARFAPMHDLIFFILHGMVEPACMELIDFLYLACLHGGVVRFAWPMAQACLHGLSNYNIECRR